VIGHGDPKDTWDQTEAWLRRNVAIATLTNRDLLTDRAEELACSVSDQFAIPAGSGLVLDLQAADDTVEAVSLAPASSFTTPGGRLAPFRTAARSSFYLPMMLGTVASGLLGLRPAGSDSGAGDVGGARGGHGRKIIKDERQRQLTYRQQQARTAARKFVVDVAFRINQQTRDGLHATQRRLRDDFSERALLLERSATQALAAVQRAGALDEEHRRDRRQPHRAAGRCGRFGHHRRGADAAGGGPREAARSAATCRRRQGQGRQVDAAQCPAGGGAGPTDAGECTKIVTWYRRGASASVLVHPRGGPPVVRPGAGRAGRWRWTSAALTAADVDRIEVTWPTSRLAELTIIDTPGIASISQRSPSGRTGCWPPTTGWVPVADAVLYLMRHTHASDVRFLESFHDDDLVHGTPINSIGVLSRADEIGSCRLDAMEVAERIAMRYERDSRIRRLCPVVVPVDGLLAHAATTLQEAEYALLAAVARAPQEEIEQVLLTADRFATRPSSTLTELERAHLLDRLGLFGVRLSVELIRSGRAQNASELSTELAAISGLDRLRAVLLRQFLQRSRVLKARSALAVLTDVLRSGGCGQPGRLGSAVEELAAGTHEFAEVRLLSTLRSGAVELSTERAEELDRLLGGEGHDPLSRLGLAAETGAEEVASAALAVLERWRRLAEHPLSGRTVQLAAQVAVRTAEGLAAAAASPAAEPG